MTIAAKKRILITGGSGFIGTNLVDHFLKLDFQVHNVDICSPQNPDQMEHWIKCDICDLKQLGEVFEKNDFDYVVHLAARTDLRGKTLEDYSANIIGVANVVACCAAKSDLVRVMFASSMLVNEVGVTSRGDGEFRPTTLYGESKVLGEKIVQDNCSALSDYCILRPTSIWGEWFAEPYRQFFDLIIAGRYFDLGSKSCTKTYGYIGNAIFQIERILAAETNIVRGKIFYIGDAPALQISSWARDISSELGKREPLKLPFFIFKLGSVFGDFLKHLGLTFPLDSFRLKNMTTDNIIDLEETYKVCGTPPFSYGNAIKRTILWINRIR